MPGVLVTDPETGEQFSVEQSQVAADPGAFQIVPGQTIAAELGAGAVGEFALEETLGGPEIGRQLTAQERAAKTREIVEEEQYGGIAESAKQLGRGALSAATLGLSEYALTAGDTAIEREIQQAKRRVGADYFAAGELIGDVALGAATGGGVAGRIAARGAGLGRQALGAAADGAISELSSAIGRSALSDEPLSSSSIASSISLGGFLGGAGGLALGGLGKAAKALSADDLLTAAAGSGDEFAALLQRGDDVALGRSANELAGRAGPATKQVRLNRLFSKRGRAPEMTRSAASQLLRQVEGRVAKAPAIRTALADIEAGAAGAGVEISDELLSRARLALDDYDVAARRAGDTMPAIAKEVEQAAAGATIKAAPEAVPAMRALDAADRDLAGIFKEFQQYAPPAGVADAPQAGMVSRALDTLGAMEIGGIPGVSMIPGVGPLMGALAKVRTLSRVTDKLSTVRNTPSVRAAMKAATDADRLSAITKRVVGGVAKLDALPGVRRGMTKVASIAPRKVASLWADARDSAGVDLNAAIAANAPDLPDEVRADAAALAGRKMAYLRDALPSPPAGMENVASDWLPNKIEARQFGEVTAALDDPFGAVGDVFSGRAVFGQAVVDAIKDVYPAVHGEVQASLLENAARLVKMRSRAVVAEWSRLWDVPLLPENQPSYRLPPSEPPPAQPAGIQAPPTSAVSATAGAHELRRPGRLG